MLATAANRVAEKPVAAAPRYRGIGDFMLLGGSSLLLLPLILLLPLKSHSVSNVLVVVALLVNYPHFANSYQIFYRGFSDRIGSSAPAVQRRRYLYAGVLVPLVIAGILAYCFVSADRTALGLAGDAMALFVGWHYVKQGYGMLMVDGARTRRFFSKWEKQALLANAYAVWALGWILTNGGGQTRHLRGVAFYSFDLPRPIEYAAIAATVATSIAVGVMIARRLASKRSLPVTGIVAYLVTLYLWMVAVHVSPIWVLIVPSLHSLQYLAIVWRFERTRSGYIASNEAALGVPRSLSGGARFFRFLLGGFALGVAGFYIIPSILDDSITPALAGNGPTQFFAFALWILINIHHYFIDSVMWRSENPDAKRFLFGTPAPVAATPKPASEAQLAA